MISDTQKKATTKYNRKAYDGFCVRMRKDGELTRDEIAKAAEQAGLSLNQYFLTAVQEKMAKEKAGQ